MRGTIKFFDNSKGWGFITDENGKDGRTDKGQAANVTLALKKTI